MPHLLFPWIRICRFTPTCSRYTYQAIERYGILYGSLLGVKRIVRCHPWSEGGRDEVPRA
ncbi:membrane protein insertion efficiency factor YidD [Candidatus Gottesmanbacteria bacterium]|nr:membrane protein insertion efficiency factor YidD [Candidatus Gottesmanbacteria bacterium]